MATELVVEKISISLPAETIAAIDHGLSEGVLKDKSRSAFFKRTSETELRSIGIISEEDSEESVFKIVQEAVNSGIDIRALIDAEQKRRLEAEVTV